MNLRLSPRAMANLYGLMTSGNEEQVRGYADMYDELTPTEKGDFAAYREKMDSIAQQPMQVVAEQSTPGVAETAVEPAPAAEAPEHEVPADTWKYRLYDLKLTGDDTAFRKEFLALTPAQKAQFDAFESFENARLQVMHPHLAHLAIRHTADRPARPQNSQPAPAEQRAYQQHVVRARPAIPAPQVQTHPEAVRPETPRTGKVRTALGRLATRLRFGRR